MGEDSLKREHLAIRQDPPAVWILPQHQRLARVGRSYAQKPTTNTPRPACETVIRYSPNGSKPAATEPSNEQIRLHAHPFRVEPASIAAGVRSLRARLR